jgi:S-DNA-T family DNA segregation ATPase FtsK/SpoIIIE
MEERYKLLAHCGFRDIESFNKRPPEKLPSEFKVYSDPTSDNRIPYIVMIIDELADLMMISAKDCEESITRIAQMARAVGIHLVIATQRPSVNIITGLIKANFPCRIAFQVSSKVDSRTILDMIGAEKLLGQGDMLFLPGGSPKPIRVQSSFISNKELEEVVKFIKSQALPIYTSTKIEEEIFQSDNLNLYENMEEDNQLYEKAVNIAIENGQISTSMIQRYLRIGYNRAARLIDMMEAEGIIGPSTGSRPREVLIKSQKERI